MPKPRESIEFKAPPMTGIKAPIVEVFYLHALHGIIAAFSGNPSLRVLMKIQAL